MKQFFLGYFLSALLIPTLSMAQTAQLTEQLGKTVLYGDLALSPDGSHLTWVQSTAATTSKRTYIQATSGNSSPRLVNLEAAAERIDNPAASISLQLGSARPWAAHPLACCGDEETLAGLGTKDRPDPAVAADDAEVVRA